MACMFFYSVPKLCAWTCDVLCLLRHMRGLLDVDRCRLISLSLCVYISCLAGGIISPHQTKDVQKNKQQLQNKCEQMSEKNFALLRHVD